MFILASGVAYKGDLGISWVIGSIGMFLVWLKELQNNDFYIMDMMRRMAMGVFDIAKKNIEEKIKSHIDELGIINIDNLDSLDPNIGEIVRDKQHNRYMVVREKTKFQHGLLAGLNMVKNMWYHCLTYCPYSRTVSADGGCRFVTGSISRTDGMANTLKIQSLNEFLRRNPESIGGCPAPIHEFPIFDGIKCHNEGAYIPAIDELYDVFRNHEIQSIYRNAVALCNNNFLLKDTAFKIWSSTDNDNNRKLFGEEAFSLLLNSDLSVIAQSVRKDEMLFVVLFKRF